MQISSTSVFAFVEGRLDRPFFDRIASNTCSPSGVQHKIISTKELPGSTGGKPTLLSTFKLFRKNRHLSFSAFGMKKVCLFIADKDADDFTGKLLRSPHLIYSPTYDLEGYLFSCGNISRALADACGITIEQSLSLIPDPQKLIASAATYWREWVALCLISQAESINCGCTFDRTSQVNTNPLDPPDLEKVNEFKSILASALQISQCDFDSNYNKTLKKIDLSIKQGKPLRYFKGKWLSHIMQRHLEQRPKIPDANINGIGEKLGIALVGQVAEKPGCCFGAYYKKSFDMALTHLN